MKKRKENGENKLIKKISIIISILIILLIILLLIEYLPENPIKNLTKEPELYVIEDECSLILNRLLHQIKNEGECKITCRNECTIRDKDFHDSEFIEKENACHVCNCYCK